MQKILIADDEAHIRRLVCDFLRREGYEPLEAEDGEQALSVFHAHPDTALMLLDVMMPDMDGIAMCRRIRETNNIPIIMVSAKTQDIDKIVGLSTGADDYVAKPFNPLELMARVKSQLRRYREAARAPGSDFLKASGNQQGNPSGCLLRRKHQADTDRI